MPFATASSSRSLSRSFTASASASSSPSASPVLSPRSTPTSSPSKGGRAGVIINSERPLVPDAPEPPASSLTGRFLRVLELWHRYYTERLRDQPALAVSTGFPFVCWKVTVARILADSRRELSRAWQRSAELSSARLGLR